jgi:prepilin-type N-terminal cleavage/methylation domain-containing protein
MARMAFPISSTRRTDVGRRGFTLVELMVAATISSFILLGVLSSFLLIGRTGANAANYADLESEARAALEVFSREVRQAYFVESGYSSTTVTLRIPDSSATRNALGYTVTYTFSTGAGTFSRTGPPINNPSGTSTTEVLVSGIETISGTNPLNYYRYVTGGGYLNGFTNNTAANGTEIKQIEINFLIRRTDVTVTAATNKVLSARFILRNK